MLEDYRMSIDAVSNLVKVSNNEEEFDKAVCTLRSTTAEEFKGKWVAQGFNTTLEQVWGYLIRKHYLGMVASIVASSTKRNLSDVKNNSTALEYVAYAVVQRVGREQIKYGDDLKALVNKEVSSTYNSNRYTFSEKFDVKDRDHDVSPALADVPNSTVVTSNNWERILGPKGITPDEVRIILEDISLPFLDTKLNKSDGEETDDFTIYESFLRTHFKVELEEFNERFKGYVQVKLPDHTSESKYAKYDSLMYRIYKDFIIKGINRENVDQLQNLIVRIVPEISVTNIAPIFGHKEVSGTGRSASRYVLSSEKAVDKYDRLMFGLISLSRLVNVIRRAGRSPYEINPYIFTDKVLGMSSKFTSIAQIVKYSNLMVETIDKYGFTNSIGMFKTLQSSRKDTGLIINNNKNTVIFENRTNKTVDDLSSSILGIVRSNNSSGELISEFPYPSQEWVVNIFTLALALDKGLSPFIAINPACSPALALSEHNVLEDEDLVFDFQALEESLGIKDFPYNTYEFDINNYDDFTDRLLETVPEGRLDESKNVSNAIRKGNYLHFAWLLDDLRQGGLQHNIKILVAVYRFVDNFEEFVIDFKQAFKGDRVTSIDFDTAIYKDKLFEPLHDILDANRVKRNSDIYLVMHALLKPYYKELTEEHVREFVGSPVNTPAFESFKSALFSRTFATVRNNFVSAKAGLYNLTNDGRSIRLSESDLAEALNNMPVIDEYESQFREYYKDVATDELGYYVDSRGFLYQVIDEDNCVGAIHSTGVWVFTNKETKPWK